MPAPESQPAEPTPAPRRRKSGRVVPERPRWHGRLAARLIHVVVHGVDATLRYRLENPEPSLAVLLERPVIFAIWHNRLALSLVLYRRYVQRTRPHRRMAAMVSASRDGGMLARVLELFGVAPVRGSSSRRGPQAMLEMTSWAERGYDLALTPDGPRGPRYVVQEGVVAAAQLTGYPILPVSYRLDWKYQAGSWDRFQIPLPGSRCVVRFGDLIQVPRAADDPEREQLRRLVEERLRAITVD